MKRIVSILLLLIFLFNVGGYYLLFVGLHHRADQLLSRKIEANQYDGTETIELKIPVTLPYPLQQNGFERVDGRFEHNGTYYKLIKQKLENDTVYIVCIRDNEEKRLNTVVTDFIKINHSLPASSKALKLLQGFCKDFESGLQTEVEIHSRLVVNIVSKTTSQYVVSDAIHAKTTPPPECLA